MIIFTIKQHPLKLELNDIMPVFSVQHIDIAIRKSPREFIIDNNCLLDDNEFWFYIRLLFPYHRHDGLPDTDAIITDGKEYYLVNTSLVSSNRKKKRLVFNRLAKELIDDALKQFYR
jgi:hypothetical protein